jgi:NADP-dependent 3-hydroxy acid dehydrogenase YdfG
MNLFDLTGKKALITGGKGLLAPIWKETLENAGADVMTWDLPDFDVRDRELLLRVAERYTPDIIVNNAAWDSPPTSGATFWGDFEGILDVNLFGVRNVCEAFIPKMINNGGGVIVNIGSIQGWLAADFRNYVEPFQKPIAYNISKWALRSFAKSISVQYGKNNIRCVTPSFSAYDGGKLDPVFLSKFIKNVPLGRCISKQSLQTTLLYCICCPELSGADWLVDAGYSSW